MDKAEKEVMAAIRGGVNYLDTAYIYPGSEAAVGEILERNHCRDAVKIATKLPHYLIKSLSGVEKTFQEELKRLKTSYIDYYLLHMLTDVPTWEKLRKMGVQEWIEKKMAAGEIRNIGRTMAIPMFLSSSWMPMTGISARFNTIIWMNAPRRAWMACGMPTAKDCL